MGDDPRPNACEGGGLLTKEIPGACASTESVVITTSGDGRHSITGLFKPLLIAGGALIGLIFLVGVVEAFITSGTENRFLAEAALTRKLGLCLGFAITLFGIMMTWLGIESSFKFKGSANNLGVLALTASSPGLLFAFIGAGTMCLTLGKEIEYESGVTQQEVASEIEMIAQVQAASEMLALMAFVIDQQQVELKQLRGELASSPESTQGAAGELPADAGDKPPGEGNEGVSKPVDSTPASPEPHPISERALQYKEKLDAVLDKRKPSASGGGALNREWLRGGRMNFEK